MSLSSLTSTKVAITVKTGDKRLTRMGSHQNPVAVGRNVKGGSDVEKGVAVPQNINNYYHMTQQFLFGAYTPPNPQQGLKGLPVPHV